MTQRASLYTCNGIDFKPEATILGMCFAPHVCNSRKPAAEKVDPDRTEITNGAKTIKATLFLDLVRASLSSKERAPHLNTFLSLNETPSHRNCGLQKSSENFNYRNLNSWNSDRGTFRQSCDEKI